ncbi:MAG: hydroxymethylbilane synthase [Bdellovibrionales bacterium]|nr:hydroxymethylbilane synthase [Bdellovibrionales bacterium]
MSVNSLLKLGTRRSLLARSQSAWVARELEAAHPGLRVELVGIDTRGDKIVDVPLREVEGKEFFVKELDDALLDGRVDLTVHSMKDLSLDRPEGIRLGAVPPREDPRDVILFSRRGGAGPMRIGTSSPRRLENLPSFLETALPAPAPELQWEEIRGNVNTRLARLHEPVGSPRRLDGVVLALAGLNRLHRDAEGGRELARLLEGLSWMVAPVTESPSAPAQGALAVECRADDERVARILRAIHDQRSQASAQAERALLAEFGGGCHQRFGATALARPGMGVALWVRGKDSSGRSVDALRWSAPPVPARGAVAWNGHEARASGAEPLPGARAFELRPRAAVFAAHARAVTPEWHAAIHAAGARLWTSGFASWGALARQGLWVEGCAEGLGLEHAAGMIQSPALALPPADEWILLTHEGAGDATPPGWQGARVVSTYRVPERTYMESERAALRKATHVYWSSGSQFRTLGALAPAGCHHACGPGRTAQELQVRGLSPLAIFPDVNAWLRWVKGES